MFKRLILFAFIMLISTKVYAGAGVCHDGQGKITQIEWDADYGAVIQYPNCTYYADAEFFVLKSEFQNVPKKHIKWDDGPVEMSQGEKDAVDAQLAQDAIDSELAQQTAFDDALTYTISGDANLTRFDSYVDSMSSVSDLRGVLKKMARYIYKTRGAL